MRNFKKEAEKLTGKVFHRLTIKEVLDQKSKFGNRLAICECECGKTYKGILYQIKCGHIKSCGCLTVEAGKKNLCKAWKVSKENGLFHEPRIASAISVYNNYKDGNLSFEDFLKLSQQNCFYCGASPSNVRNRYVAIKTVRPERLKSAYFTYNGLDRVNNNLGHTKDNVVTCCADCNRAKLKRSKDEFIRWANLISTLHPIDLKI